MCIYLYTYIKRESIWSMRKQLYFTRTFKAVGAEKCVLKSNVNQREEDTHTQCVYDIVYILH